MAEATAQDTLTNRDPNIELPEHPVIKEGLYLPQKSRPCGNRLEGTSLVQNHPEPVRSALDLESGQIPFPVVFPEINAVMYIYTGSE